jgi:hypothetical protein
MSNSKPLAGALMLCCAFAASEVSTAQEAPIPPAGPFEAVHLIRVKPGSPDAEKRMLGALAAMNEAIVKAGCESCIYHLWKADLVSTDAYTYIQISFWPSGEVYDRVHSSPAYAAASNKWPELRSLLATEIYNRYVEIK